MAEAECPHRSGVDQTRRAGAHTAVTGCPAPAVDGICPRGMTPMAQRVVVTLFDDIDGGEATETVSFGIDGRAYEIDLSADNAEKLRNALAPYLAAGRRQSRSGKVYRRTSVAPDPAAVRAWAQSRGMDLPARGRIPKHVYEAFAEAS